MEARLFEEGTIPEWATPEWYAERETAPHLEQAGHHERLTVCANQAFRVTDENSTVVDLGAGDGGLLSLLAARGVRGYGYDLQQTNVDAALGNRGIDVRLGNVLDIEIPSADVVIATEMLEHLVDPHGLLGRIWAAGVPHIVVSSPYTETADSHYGFHLWAWDIDGYAAMIEAAGYRVLDTQVAWICQCVLAERVDDR